MAEVKGIRYFDISGTLIDSTGLYPAVVVYTKIGIFPITVMLGERVFCTGFYVPAFVTPTDGSSINGGIFFYCKRETVYTACRCTSIYIYCKIFPVIVYVQ